MIASNHPELPKFPNGWMMFVLILAFCFLVIALSLFFKGCGDQDTVLKIDPIKKEISKQKEQKDSIQERVVYKDRERLVYITKWRNLKPSLDTVPCPEALKEVITLTDSIITVDSSLIASLKAELLIDGLIINNQDRIIKMDSVMIRHMAKKIKRQKVKTVLAGVLGFGVGLLIK